jgi:hypothetical protein
VVDNRSAVGKTAYFDKNWLRTLDVPLIDHKMGEGEKLSAGQSKRDPARSRQWSIFWMMIYLGGYIGLLTWFKWVDVYHSQFATTGIVILIYNFFRVAFIFYLFWIVHAVGTSVLRLFFDSARTDACTLDSLAIRFFTGVGVWHVAMLALGFLNLYRPPLAVALTIPIVCLSYFDLRNAMSRLYQNGDFKPGISRFGGTRDRSNAIFAVALGALFLAAFLCLLFVKGLYPAGGHDYYTHYFPYLRSVITQGGLWPNDVWYHFYYSKGAGLYFLGMLLTDPLAPQLVTFCFIIASSIALFQFLSRIAPQTWWPHIGIILSIGLYIYTPGLAEYKANGGWGDFEKLHELNAALVIAILWMVSSALEQRGHAALEWLVAAGSSVVAAIIINVTMAAYLGALFSILAVWLLLRGRRFQSVSCLALAAVSGASLSSILLINYFATGLLNDQGILFFWKYADAEKLYNWGALPWVLAVHRETARLAASSLPLSLEFPFLCLRLDLLWPLIGGGLLASLVAILLRRINVEAKSQVLVLVVAIVIYLVLAVGAGRSQPISFYRYSSFMFSVSIAVGVMLWTALGWRSSGVFGRWTFGALVPVFVLFGCFAAAFAMYQPGAFSQNLKNAWLFARGAFSIDHAYTTQDNWPGRLPWGGIYPGARGAYSIVGPSTRIWSMHIHSYCMLPDCLVETYPAFVMGRDWDRLMFETAEDGREVLQSAGLNYFLFSRDLGIVDVLPRSELFSPANINRYLGIRWTDGKTALLTWAGSDTVPLDQEWLADYRRAVERSLTANSFPYAEMKNIYINLRAKPHPWRSFELTW